jgi:hypothetical protein
VSW